MARPSVLPLFDTNGTRIAAPAGIRISDGYAVNAPLPSQDVNYMFYWVSQWIAWLATGNVDFNNVEIVGTLLQDGAATFQSSVDMEGGLATFVAWALKGAQTLTPLALGLTHNFTLPGATGSLIYNATWSGSSSPGFARGYTGFVAPTDGRVAIIRNLEQNNPSGAYASHRVVLYHEHTGSTAANRIHLPNNALGLQSNNTVSGATIPGLTIPPDGVVALRYDLATARWNVLWTSFKILGAYQQRAVCFSPSANFSNASYAGLSGGSGNDIITSSSAGVWKVWSSDIQHLDPGDTVIGLNVFAKIAGAVLNVTLKEKTFSGSTAVVNNIGTVNAGAGLVTGGVAQLFQITGLNWVTQDNATYFVQVDGANGSSPESLYEMQFLVAKQTG